MGWFERGMGRWRWVDEDEDGDGSMKIRDGLAEDEDKGWVGGVACMQRRGHVSRGGSGHHCRGWVWTRTAIWLARMCLGSSGGVCLSSLSLGVYFPDCGSLDWSSVCGNSSFGVSCSVELGHNWAWRVSVRSACEKLERVCEECNWFEGKIKLEMVLRAKWVILRSTQKLISIWPNFLCLPNTQRGVKWFPETLFSQNKRTLGESSSPNFYVIRPIDLSNLTYLRGLSLQVGELAFSVEWQKNSFVNVSIH